MNSDISQCLIVQPTDILQCLIAPSTEISQCLILLPIETPQCLIVHHIYNSHLPTFKAYVTKLTSENLAMQYATDIFLKQVEISNLSLGYQFKVVISC